MNWITNALLVVEDNTASQLVIQAQLDQLGYQSELASDGMQALLAVAQKRYRLILMDIHMPVMSGLETALKIRQMEAQIVMPRSIIIAHSADSSDDLREECADIGMDGFLVKPLSLAALAAVLKQWLGNPQHTHQPQAWQAQSALQH